MSTKIKQGLEDIIRKQVKVIKDQEITQAKEKVDKERKELLRSFQRK